MRRTNTAVDERRIVGGIVAGHVLPSAVPVDPSDFSDRELAACLDEARRLEKDGIGIDAEVLAARLAERDIAFYSPTDLDLMAIAAQSASVVHDSAAKVKESSLRTHLLAAAASVATMEQASGRELLRVLREALARAERDYSPAEADFVWISELKEKMRGVYRDLKEGVSYAVPTYFMQLDRTLGDGLSRGDLHIICGFTGQGKSALALNFARNQAKAGHKVGIVSREMSDVENVMRLQTTDSGVPRWAIKKNMHDADHEALSANLETLAELPIALSTRTETVEELRTQIGRMVEEHGMQIVYVDYLQLMHSERNKSRAEEVAAVSRTLKLIAMENRIPVVALCQFNRGAVSANKWDLLSYLKESSAIEQDASTILYVKFDKDEEMAKTRSGTMTMLKNRNGASFTDIPVTYRGEVFTFEEAVHVPSY